MPLARLPEGVTVFERGWLSANGILFSADDGPTALVDTGYCTHAEQTAALVSEVLGPRPLDLLLNTHLHSDHCGGNAMLQARFPGIRTWIPPGQAAAVSCWDEVALTYAPTGQRCPRFRFEALLQPGTEIQLGASSWQIHAAPGHDPHSIVLFEPRTRTLISADALWQNGFGVVFPELEGDTAFAQVAATLDLIEKLQPATVIPGHGPVFDELTPALREARRRLEGFVGDPRKHARHAAKVLIKFKALELKSIAYASLVEWAVHTVYFGMIHRRWFATSDLQPWIESIIADLVESQALRRISNVVVDN